MIVSMWEEIHGFESPGEYVRFVAYIEQQVAQGHALEEAVDPDYGSGKIFGGRWFRDVESGEIWRLVQPDLPFRGCWVPVEKQQRGSRRSD
ncbi:MAG TPA: hypothetical protein VFN13_08445 [Rudaea sp.]|nr:hypothetical protein [Rudaea sp.]